MAPVAVEWLADASPKLHTTSASAGQQIGASSLRARPMAKATPSARGRWDAMVEVCGMMARSGWPNTLWRPPAIGSSEEASMPRSTSATGSWPATWRALAT